MKKITLIMLMVTTLLACGSSKIVDEAEETIRGDWRLSSITYPGNAENLKVTLLNNVPARCLEGSTWNFISNNNTGSYNPAGLTCETGPNFFIWKVSEMDAAADRYDLLLKPTDADYKSVSGNAGYRLNLTNLSADQMIWEQTITFEGEPFTIRMNFNKI